MFHYRIRGMHATALTKLVLDAGHCVSKPSDLIIDRFPDISCDLTVPPDAYILDNDMKTGFSCRGDPQAVNVFEQLVRTTLEFPFIVKPALNPNTIIKARVTQVSPHHIRLSLGNGKVGIISNIRKKNEYREGDELLVAVRRQLSLAKTEFEVSSSFNIVGKTVTLVSHRHSPIFSRFIPKEKREMLRTVDLDLEDFPFPCTVRWRSASADVSLEEISSEIMNLKDTLRKLLERADTARVGEVLHEGTADIQVLVGAADKHKLDAIRRTVTPTVHGHHVWKGLNPPMGDFVAYMEALLAEDPSLDAILSGGFHSFVIEKLKEAGTVVIYHWKPTGRYFKLGSFMVEAVTPTAIILKRVVRAPGTYDGLNVKKEPGDVIKTVIPRSEESWWIKHAYYSSDGELKGEYVNINTPLEMGFNNIRYFDLIVDVVCLPTEDPKIVDVDELEQLVSYGIITSDMKERIIQLAEQIKNEIPTVGDSLVTP